MFHLPVFVLVLATRLKNMHQENKEVLQGKRYINSRHKNTAFKIDSFIFLFQEKSWTAKPGVYVRRQHTRHAKPNISLRCPTSINLIVNNRHRSLLFRRFESRLINHDRVRRLQTHSIHPRNNHGVALSTHEQSGRQRGKKSDAFVATERVRRC